jgi:hypothetical protein
MMVKPCQLEKNTQLAKKQLCAQHIVLLIVSLRSTGYSFAPHASVFGAFMFSVYFCSDMNSNSKFF